MARDELHLARLRKQLQEDPGADCFVELARELESEPSTRAEAREVCFRGLSAAPENLQGRLQLAKLFYLDELTEFCIRELMELQRKAPELSALNRLLSMLGGETVEPSTRVATKTAPAPEEETDEGDVLAEIDMDTELADILAEMDGDND